MNSVIFDPLEEFENKYKALHSEKTAGFFDNLVARSGINIEENRETVRQYHDCNENLSGLKKRLNLLRVLRVLMYITIVLIPLVILKTTPKIQKLRADIENAAQTAAALFARANEQMLPLNNLFTDRDGLNIIESVIPLISFEKCFSAKQEEDMKVNYDYKEPNEGEQSATGVLAGNYNGNPFIFENKIVHTMGMETYHGYKTIHWTETGRDASGRTRRYQRSETLHATVTKPKPFYNTQVVLTYCSQGAPDLSFNRKGTHIEKKSEEQIERHVRRGARKLGKKTEKAIRENKNFMSMSNSDFDVLFNALDRDNEVQFRTLFTPLAQTNMVSLIVSESGYGDDFDFAKAKRTNRIVSGHSQGRQVNLLPEYYKSYSYDSIRENFMAKNKDFFKAVYFDLAPLLAIPAYQERPVHSLKPLPDYAGNYSAKERETLANAIDCKYTVHPKTKTQAIIKSSLVNSKNNVDKTCVTAYSYDIKNRVETVSVRGGDGRYHNVQVDWDEYIPLKSAHNFYVSACGNAAGQAILASRNGLCMYIE